MSIKLREVFQSLLTQNFKDFKQFCPKFSKQIWRHTRGTQFTVFWLELIKNPVCPLAFKDPLSFINLFHNIFTMLDKKDVRNKKKRDDRETCFCNSSWNVLKLKIPRESPNVLIILIRMQKCWIILRHDDPFSLILMSFVEWFINIFIKSSNMSHQSAHFFLNSCSQV